MAWRYQQSTGILASADDSLRAVGYAGHPPYVNDPDAQHLHEQGPLPRGLYTIGPAFHHPRLGALAMPLLADPGVETYGRGSFYLHGDNGRGDQSASEGCIVQDHETRAAVAVSEDRRLEVIR